MKTNVNTTGAGSAQPQNYRALLLSHIEDHVADITTAQDYIADLGSLFNAIRKESGLNEQAYRLAGMGMALSAEWAGEKLGSTRAELEAVRRELQETIYSLEG